MFNSRSERGESRLNVASIYCIILLFLSPGMDSLNLLKACQPSKPSIVYCSKCGRHVPWIYLIYARALNCDDCTEKKLDDWSEI